MNNLYLIFDFVLINNQINQINQINVSYTE